MVGRKSYRKKHSRRRKTVHRRKTLRRGGTKTKIVHPELQLSNEDIKNILKSLDVEDENNEIKEELRKVRRVKGFGKNDQFYYDHFKNAKTAKEKHDDLYYQASARLTNYMKYGDDIWNI